MAIKPVYIEITPQMGELHWEQSPSDELLAQQLGIIQWLEQHEKEHIETIRQGFTSIAILWKEDRFQTRFKNQYMTTKFSRVHLSDRIWQIPVCYDPEYGKDLGSLAVAKKLSLNSLIKLHAENTYRIHFFGFLPGFMYLNGLPEVLHTPRKPFPDRTVDPGSVAIGGAQTGIYPRESPGGWHIIGRSPVIFFDIEKDPPVWAQAGESLEFVPIDGDEMSKLLKNPPHPYLK